MKKKHTSEPVFFNRELSWLAFNGRVLEMALDPAVPLFERLKFLAIVSSNLDEFYMVRVGGLQAMARAGKRSVDAAGFSPARQLDLIAAEVHEPPRAARRRGTVPLLP